MDGPAAPASARTATNAVVPASQQQGVVDDLLEMVKQNFHNDIAPGDAELPGDLIRRHSVRAVVVTGV
ncbi:hypothetical protein V7R84_10810 [Arachnia propionica]|uniref:hypothetical protein n=1 Tax=Arachnia propionica TaxID=1750 RepID=UPI0030CBA580